MPGFLKNVIVIIAIYLSILITFELISTHLERKYYKKNNNSNGKR